MAATTENFTLTSSAYQDVSEGASDVWFEIPFDRNTVTDVRVVLASSLPAADTIHYFKAGPSRPIASQDLPQSFPMSFQWLASTDRVYLRADSASLSLTVFRK